MSPVLMNWFYPVGILIAIILINPINGDYRISIAVTVVLVLLVVLVGLRMAWNAEDPEHRRAVRQARRDLKRTAAEPAVLLTADEEAGAALQHAAATLAYYDRVLSRTRSNEPFYDSYRSKRSELLERFPPLRSEADPA